MIALNVFTYVHVCSRVFMYARVCSCAAIIKNTIVVLYRVFITDWCWSIRLHGYCNQLFFPQLVIVYKDDRAQYRHCFSNIYCITYLYFSILLNNQGKRHDYEIGICCFSAKHAALRSNYTNWLLRIMIMCPSGAIWTVSMNTINMYLTMFV